MLEGKSASTFVSWAHVTHTAVIPAVQSTKKEGEDMLAMRLAPDQVTFNGKPLKNLLWNMQKMPAKPLRVSIDMERVWVRRLKAQRVMLSRLW